MLRTLTVDRTSMLQDDVPDRQDSLRVSLRTCPHVKEALASNVCATCEHMRCLR